MRPAFSSSILGLDLIHDHLTLRYRMDDSGRLVADRNGGVPPRYIFARSAEGSIWRFRCDLDPTIVRGIAKLAGRERGWPNGTIDEPPPPERLAMMARWLGDSDRPVERRELATSVREEIRIDGVLRAEYWLFD